MSDHAERHREALARQQEAEETERTSSREEHASIIIDSVPGMTPDAQRPVGFMEGDESIAQAPDVSQTSRDVGMNQSKTGQDFHLVLDRLLFKEGIFFVRRALSKVCHEAHLYASFADCV